MYDFYKDVLTTDLLDIIGKAYHSVGTLLKLIRLNEYIPTKRSVISSMCKKNK